MYLWRVSLPNSKIVTQSQKYTSTLHSILSHHNVFQRADNLLSLPRETAITQVEKLDCDITRSMIAAEKRIKKPSVSPFSSKLAQACIRVTLLKLQIKVVKHTI